MLQYADDTLVMLDASKESILNLKAVILWFEAISSLHVNFAKSCLDHVNEVSNEEEILKLWGYGLGSFLDVYLGMPLGENSRKEACGNR